jgi:molybdopterin/thiamine biosynthesis adenylyltransferase
MKNKGKSSFAEEFYSRQVILKELGYKGQKKLCESKIAIVGLGGLGSVSSLYLALAGVGHLRLIDQDIVETPNLHRQILYTTDSLDYPKVEVAAAKLKKYNPLIKTEVFSENLNSGNAERLLDEVDLVVDGLDNMATRFLVNRTCVNLKIPYVFGAAIGLEGNVSVFSAPSTPCLECILPNYSDNELMSCDTRGVLGVTPGIIGAIQAFEAIKVLVGIGKPLNSKLMVCDFSDMSFSTITLSKRNNCPACSGILPKKLREKLIWICGKNTANINPEKYLDLNLNQLSELITKKGFRVRVQSQLALVFDYGNLEVSVFIGGRMLIKNVQDEQTALSAYKEILAMLEPVQKK